MLQGNQLELPVACRTRRGTTGIRYPPRDKTQIFNHKTEYIDQEGQHLAIVIESHSKESINQEEKAGKPVNQNIEEIQELDQDYDSDGKVQYVKGRFTPEEQKIITDAVGQFLAISEINYDDFLLILQEKNVINKVLRKAQFFQTVAKALPHRSVFSCYRFIKRCFNDRNRKGKWTEEETNKLIDLVNTQGKNWSYIGKVLGRSTDNVYDRYKSLGYENASKRMKCQWQVRQFIRLLLLVNQRVNQPFLDERIRNEREKEVEINAREAHDLKQNHYNYKDTPLPLIELAMKYINHRIRSINIETISWSSIAHKLRSRSLIDCKNKFMQLLEYALKVHPYDDLKIIEFIQGQRVESQTYIQWLSWNQDQIEWPQAKNRFVLLKKGIKSKSLRTFDSVLEEIKKKLLKKKGQHH